MDVINHVYRVYLPDNLQAHDYSDVTYVKISKFVNLDTATT